MATNILQFAKSRTMLWDIKIECRRILVQIVNLVKVVDNIDDWHIGACLMHFFEYLKLEQPILATLCRTYAYSLLCIIFLFPADLGNTDVIICLSFKFPLYGLEFYSKMRFELFLVGLILEVLVN